MSNYGKLWQQVSDIRTVLKQLVPGINTNSIAEAVMSVSVRQQKIDELLHEWSCLEIQMNKEDD